MKRILAILFAVAGAWTARADVATIDVATVLKYDDLPAHVRLNFAGSYQGSVFSVPVKGTASGATLNRYSNSGWTIMATADAGYELTAGEVDLGTVKADAEVPASKVPTAPTKKPYRFAWKRPARPSTVKATM